MKLKELKRTVNVCWSPAEHYPVTLAAGSAAQQVDASFSSSSHLELYSLNLEDPGLDLEVKSSIQTQHKFQKLVWSGTGVIVGGCDGGLLQFYSAEKLLQKASDPLLGSCTKHSGHISALDINPYQKNLLASGASDSEIFIWDLNNTSQPMAPGTRNQPYDHVQGLAWNQQVQHILGSTFATRCVVWDLRKNEPIMKLSDSQSRTRWRSLAWHPSVATQLCIASEDDQVPVVQLWDLRLAASPLATLEGHQKGVMALSWCKQDPDLLLSAGKDGRVLCWNPNNTKPGGELLSELSQQQQWVFEVSWCPRDPSLLVSASFDQQVTVRTLLAGSRPESNTHDQNNIMDSFGGVDSFSQLPAVSRAPLAPAAPVHQLPVPPRWLRRPAAANFSFGGKLVTFERCPQETGTRNIVYISQVVSEPEVVELAAELDAALGPNLGQDPAAAERLAEYCRQKGDATLDQTERYNWFFLRANFLPTFRTEALNLLGFKQDEIPSKFKSSTGEIGDITQPDVPALSRGESTETEAELSTDTSTDLSDAHTLIERKLANLDISPEVSNVVIPNGEDTTSLICRALACGNLEEAVELCLEDKRVADALVIASLASPELVYKVQRYHLNSTRSEPVSLAAGSLLQSRWAELVAGAAPCSWRSTLAALLTHCEEDSLAHYCEMLGERVAADPDPAVSEAATICYLCGSSADRAVSRWAARGAGSDDTARALVARAAAALRGRPLQEGGKLERVINEYAWQLASQGCLQSALQALQPERAAGERAALLRDRLLHALGLARQDHRPAQVQQQQVQQQQVFGRRRTSSSHSQKRGQFDTNPYAPAGPTPYEPAPWQQSSVPAPQPSLPQRAFPQPQPQQPLQPLQPLQPPQPLQPAQPPQPPRPGSVGPTSGGLTGRSKYKVDPSVQSAPLYNQYSFNNPVQPPYGGYNSPLPDQYSTASVANTFTPINPINPSMNPLNPSVNPLNPSVNPLNPSVNPLNPSVNQLNPSANQLNPSVNGYGYYSPQQAAPEPAPPAAAPKPVAPGWNDPPMVSKAKYDGRDMSALHAGTRHWTHAIQHRLCSDEPKQETPAAAQAPITHPLFGVEPPQHVPLVPNPGQYPGQQYPGQQYPGQQYAGQQYPGQQYQEQQQYQTQYPPAAAPVYQQQQVESPAPAEAVPVAKAPLPEEFAAMQTVFDNIRTDCSNRAVNAQMKRKLEDVQKRLETLYDMLREYRLSEGAVAALRAAAALGEGAQYEAAGGAVATLATGTDFAAVAAFLPALRVLFQLAAQLHPQQHT